ncbi:helix-loop-helix DNA-binding domain-containing transcription factor [Phycomyces blakesleeanus]
MTPPTTQKTTRKRKRASTQTGDGLPVVILPPPILPYPPPPSHTLPTPPSPAASAAAAAAAGTNLAQLHSHNQSLQPMAVYCLPYSPHQDPTIFPFIPSPPLDGCPGNPQDNSGPSGAEQREQARKVSHSAIERRRRERINDKMSHLKQLIPACADQDGLHKMSILQSAIDYIHHLETLVVQMGGKEKLADCTLPKHKTPQSMVPKEVVPFIHQFNSNPPKSSLKPIDLLCKTSPRIDQQPIPMRLEHLLS